MLRSLRNPFGFLILAAMLVAACSTTMLNAVWKDPLYQERPQKIMVIGVAKKAVNRRIFEDEFVRQLRIHGTDSIASYTVLPDSQQGNQAAIAAKVAELGADTVLISRMVSKKTVQVYVPGTFNYPPPYYGTWPDYYGYGYQAMYTPGYMAEDEYAVIETNLYEAKKNKLVWGASSESAMRGSDQNQIKSYIGVMVKTMVGNRLLGR